MKLKFNYIMLKFFLKKLKKFIIILLSMTFYTNSFKPKITIEQNFNFEDEIFEDDFIKEYSNVEPFFNENVPFLKKNRYF